MIIKVLVQKKFLIPFGSFLFFLGLILNAPLEKSLNQLISKSIPKRCLSSAPEVNLGFFPLPSVSTNKDFILESKCSSLNTNLKVSNLRLSNRGFSFSPIGIKLNGELSLDDFKPIALSLSVGIDEIKIILNNSTISTLLINKLMGEKIEAEGDLEIDLIAHLLKKRFKELEVSITSKNLKLPAQMISGFNIPAMKLSPLLLSGKKKKGNELEIVSISIGKKDQGINIMGKGSISNLDNINSSNIDLMASMQLGDEVKREFSFINLLLGDPNESGEYNFKVSGKLTAPRVKSLN